MAKTALKMEEEELDIETDIEWLMLNPRFMTI